MSKLRELELQRNDLLDVVDSYRKQRKEGVILSIDLENRENESMPGKVVELISSSRASENTSMAQ